MMLLLAAAAFACPALDAEVERATVALVGGDFTEARAALDTAASSFACAAATPEQVGRYWLVEGAVAQLEGRPEAARGPFAAARAVAPGTFDDRLGPKVREAWTAVTVEGQGTLLVEPPRPAHVDGARVTTWPATAGATPHLVQILASDGSVRFGKLVVLAPGEDALVETGLPPSPEVLPSLAPAEPKRGKSPALLILAGVAAAGAGACAGGAFAQNQLMDDAGTVAALEGAFARQKVFTYSTWGLAGVSALSLGLHIALP